MEETYKLDDFLGYCEPRTFTRFYGGRMHTYCYSIKYDRNGVEKSRTEPEAISSIGYDNGKQFTKQEYSRLMDGGKKKSIFSRFTEWVKTDSNDTKTL